MEKDKKRIYKTVLPPPSSVPVHFKSRVSTAAEISPSFLKHLPRNPDLFLSSSAISEVRVSSCFSLTLSLALLLFLFLRPPRRRNFFFLHWYARRRAEVALPVDRLELAAPHKPRVSRRIQAISPSIRGRGESGFSERFSCVFPKGCS